MTREVLFAHLRHHLAQLSARGGRLSPSLYDTARVIYYNVLPLEEMWLAADWLIDQQHSDGGWGDQASDERARTTSTLAVVITLQKTGRRRAAREAQEAGIAWLYRNANAWEHLGNDIPVAAELLLPALGDQANAMGVFVPNARWEPLRALGQRRRALLARQTPDALARTSGAHSFEAWGSPETADTRLFDRWLGVGCSPAATAAFAAYRSSQPDSPHDPLQADISAYLEAAASATGTGIAGVVPTVWPCDQFLSAYALHTLAQAGLLNHPALSQVVTPLLAYLRTALTEHGLGMAAGFMPDGDDTAASIGALCTAGIRRPTAPLERFIVEDHVVSYHGELQSSVITTARAAQVLRDHPRIDAIRMWLLAQQFPTGFWPADKWHCSPFYTTWQVILALRDDPREQSREALVRARTALLSTQQRDGLWAGDVAMGEPTAAAILALTALPSGLITSETVAACQRGRTALLDVYRPFRREDGRYWLGKERYAPYDLAHVGILAALLVGDPSD